MIHPDTEVRFINENKGHGLVATKFIPAGTITWVKDKFDREFTPEQVAAMEPAYQRVLDTYCYRNNKGNYMFLWDNSRFMNHSFYANCFATAYNFEVAIRDIQPGEELTDDYGFFNIIEAFTAHDEGHERKTVYPDDLKRFHKQWDNILRGVFPRILIENQPLKELISSEVWNEVTLVAEEKKEMQSILNLYYEEHKK